MPGRLPLALRPLGERIVEANRVRTYDRGPLLSGFRRRVMRMRNRHADIIFEGDARLFEGIHLYAPGPCTVRIGHGVTLRARAVIEMNVNAELTIGPGALISYGAVIQCMNRITIGEGALIGPYATIQDSRHRYRDPGAHLADAGLDVWEVVVGAHTWVGHAGTVAADVGERAVVGAHSVVLSPVEPRTLVGGQPARVIRRLDETPAAGDGQRV